MPAASVSNVPGMSRDVGRGQLPGIAVPVLEVDVDATRVRLSDDDIRNGFVMISGRTRLCPSSTQWYDGTVLSLVTLNLAVTAEARPGQHPQHDTYLDSGSLDMLNPATWKRPMISATGVQFGSAMADAKVTVCPFAVRVQVRALTVGGKRDFVLHAKALFARVGPASPTAPAQFEVSANPIAVSIAH